MASALSMIPLYKPYTTGRELDYITAAMAAGSIAGPGSYSRICEDIIRNTVGGKQAFLVPSCSAALEMSALLLNLEPGDEVIVPSFTFVSTANAVVLRGATPVFVDINCVTLNIDPDAVEAAITPRTKAVFVVHYAGIPADMFRIMAIAKRHGLSVVEDAAQAFGSRLGGQPAGSFGALSCFSFHGTKNISAGEGGALVVNDESLVSRADIVRDKGTDRARFLAGEVSAYTWQQAGGSQIVNELTAAYLRAQLEEVEFIQRQRLLLWQRYADELSCLADRGIASLPQPPDNVIHNGHIFFLVLPDRNTRTDLVQHLRRFGIASASHYEPLHSSPAGLRHGRVSGSMHVTNRVAASLLRLPLYHDLLDEQHRVIDAVLDWANSLESNSQSSALATTR